MIKFPRDFIWGSATSAYQIEGARAEDGKGPSIWDAFCDIPARISKGDSGDIACDHYHRFEEDVALMKDMGLKAYRFSISWPRIQPVGKGVANMPGIAFYSRLIDCLLSHDIEPWVTLYHWDLPLALQLEEDGWTGSQISDYFMAYADICFSHFGDRVKNWITLNEPWVVAVLGYGQGIFAPGRRSEDGAYLAGHNLLLAHAKAVACYREKYQPSQKGQIGISNNSDWREPLSNSSADKAAAHRALEFFLGWFADPIYKGHYPNTMVERLGNRLPRFTKEEQALLKDSSDFFGLNHYTTLYAAHFSNKANQNPVFGNGGLSEDQEVELSADLDWDKTTMGWCIVPWGCRKLLEWIDARYDKPPIVITENGCALHDHVENGKVMDTGRVDYYSAYLEECYKAIQNGVQLKGYFAWSLLDNFEWTSGFSKRFGLHYVHFSTLERIPKLSARWYAEVIRNNGF